MEPTTADLLARASARAHYAGYLIHGLEVHAEDWADCQNTVCARDREAVKELVACSTSSDAPGVPSSPSSTDPRLDAVPPPTMLRAPSPHSGAGGSTAAGDYASRQIAEIDAALQELDLLGGDAPHRAFGHATWMKANFWLTVRAVADSVYLGAWNQATDGQPVPERHFKAFTRSVVEGKVPRAWEPK